jgi:uncharacterized membrane protein (UPF0127 family)
LPSAIATRQEFSHALRVNFVRKASCLLLAAGLLAGGSACNQSGPMANSGSNAPPPKLQIDPLRGHLLHAQPTLPTIKVWLGSEELIAEIAREPLQIATGMMYRTNLPENKAMIFVFPGPGPKNFYMRNCIVPLSAAYIEPDGTIAEIVDLHPGNEVGVQSRSSNLQYVLEVPQGWFIRHHVTTGAVVRTEHGSLQETFFQRR